MSSWIKVTLATVTIITCVLEIYVSLKNIKNINIELDEIRKHRDMEM